MTERIEHDPDSLARKIPMLVQARNLQAQTAQNLKSDMGRYGDLLDGGTATDELSQNVMKVVENAVTVGTSVLEALSEAIGSHAEGVNNAKTVRDNAGENATTAGDFMAPGSGGTVGRH
ncbi:hypothetical protein [Kineosporia babensis]|uniref:Uncharacterized protein n=1 Tax=Kineosporia babensis TaxID=499548 RepID=A0A9X1NC29_9ACTN|nr:hypothetical protein [Kineosporia babensis]MCD5310308.1 hypothetical protein [Kineosporia babensis]